MKNWYQNRMETGIKHRDFNVSEGKYLYLTDLQAQTHNQKNEQRVAKVDSPPKKEEVAVLADWNEYEKLQIEAQAISSEKVNDSTRLRKTDRRKEQGNNV